SQGDTLPFSALPKGDAMAIICIARQFAALGDEIVMELAALLGYRALNKEFVEQRMSDMGISAEARAKYDERKPGFWASLSQERDDYLHCLKTVLYEEASKGNCIIAGRGAFTVFSGVPGVLGIRLVAPFDIRVKRVMTHFHCDQKRAESLVKQSDHDRKGFHGYFFNLDWEDPSNYDLTINTGKASTSAIAKTIQRFKEAMVSEADEAACVTCMAELALGQEVVTHIAYVAKIPVHFLEADVHGACVTLHGVANTQGAIDGAVLAAKSVPGVSEVKNSIQVVQEFAVMP
ncbi:MAG TPA: cytidylate kinase family protein, partial [Spirochaetales bacterium]|nr:cytidylate kinase family protein [Spirochaetales bacterium]